MHINNQYELYWAEKFFARNKQAKILDFGCGLGSVVVAGQNRGIDLNGVDTYEVGGTQYFEKAQKTGLVGTKITKTLPNKLPFKDFTFDLVMANEVFEHVEDLPAILQEIWRVLKDDGYLLCLFPQKEIIHEGHTLIPMLHQFSKKSRFRFYYALVINALITRNFKKTKNVARVITILNYLDKFTFYLPKNQLMREFTKFYNFKFIEHDYILFRMNHTAKWKWFVPLMHISFFEIIISIVYQKLFGMVILAAKKKDCYE